MYPKIVAVLWKKNEKPSLHNVNYGNLAVACFSEDEVNKTATKYVTSYSAQANFDSVVIFQAIGTAVPVPIEIKPIGPSERL